MLTYLTYIVFFFHIYVVCHLRIVRVRHEMNLKPDYCIILTPTTNIFYGQNCSWMFVYEHSVKEGKQKLKLLFITN